MLDRATKLARAALRRHIATAIRVSAVPLAAGDLVQLFAAAGYAEHQVRGVLADLEVHGLVTRRNDPDRGRQVYLPATGRRES